MVHDLLMSFCKLHGRRLTDELIDAWDLALERHLDDDISIAGRAVMSEMYRMPTPADIVQRIPVKQRAEDSVRIEAGHQCWRCGKYKPTCIKEPGIDWTCRECYTGGLTPEDIKNNFRTINGILAKKGKAVEVSIPDEGDWNDSLLKRRQQ
jgi:hypothetical protein